MGYTLAHSAEPALVPHEAGPRPAPNPEAGRFVEGIVARVVTAERAKQREDHQALVDGIALAFFALESFVGIPRDEAGGYSPDAD